MSASTFQERLTKVVELVGSRAELSRRSGVPLRSIGNYLSGATRPKGEVVAHLAAAGGARVEWLLTGAEPMLLEPPKVEQPSAPPYTISASEAGPLIVALEQELGYDPGSAWTSLLIGLMTDHGLKPSGARKVLEHLAAFRAARDAA